MSRLLLDLLQGTLDTLVLKALFWGPRHGYALARWIRDTTDDGLNIEEGAPTPPFTGWNSVAGSMPSGDSPITIARPNTTI